MTDMSDTQLITLCKYCEKKVIKKVKCANCAAAFHKSCSTRKICCEKQELQKEIQENISEDSEDESINEILMESLKFENKLLVDLNKELKDMNNLLKEKIIDLENKLNSLEKPTINPFEQYTKEGKNSELIRRIIKTEVESYFNIHKNDIKNNNMTAKNISDESIRNKQQKTPTLIKENKKDHKKTSKQTNDNNSSTNLNSNVINLENRQRHIMQEIINLDVPSPQLQTEKGCSPTKNKLNTIQDKVEEQNGNDGRPSYREALRRNGETKQLNKTTQIGEGGTDEGLEGVQKRIWIFLSRVKLHVTAEKIHKYLSSKPNMKESTFLVEELKLKRTRTKAFKIGVEYALKEEVYQPKFWPKGVGFSRYTFPKNNIEDNSGQNWEEETHKEENF